MTSSTTMASDSRFVDFNSSASSSIWHSSAPEQVRKAQKIGDFEAAWCAWTTYLAKRKKPRSTDRLVSSKRSALLWALPEEFDAPEAVQLVQRLTKLTRGGPLSSTDWPQEVSRWRVETANGCRPQGALEAVAWAGAMPVLAGVLSSDDWWSLLNHLAALSAEMVVVPVEEFPFVHSLLAGELPLTLAYLFPEIGPCRKLARQARRSLETGIDTLLDGEGLPKAENMSLLRPLLACWTRCQILGQHCKKGCLNREAAGQVEWAVRQALRWTRADGSQVLGEDDFQGAYKDLFAAALDIDDDEEDRLIATLVLPRSKKAERDRASRYALPQSASHSEWSEAAVLRPDWPHSNAQLSVLYPRQTVLTELSARREVLWSGSWRCEVRLDGKLLVPNGDWEATCWVSDGDADYLELEIELTEGVRIERQMVMGRDDQFLLMADVILGEQSGELEYCGYLPLRPEIAFEQARDTREAFLVGSRRTAMVMPLALPEWQCDQRVGSLESTSEGLVLRQSIQGYAMYCPLWFDFDVRRADRQHTWRQLTVAASLEVQPNDVAVGYRVHSGNDQWLVYRSLDARANRTLLGHNLSSEMLVARFDEEGEVEPLVEVE